MHTVILDRTKTRSRSRTRRLLPLALGAIATPLFAETAGADTIGAAATSSSGVHSEARATSVGSGSGGSGNTNPCTYSLMPVQPLQVFDEDTGAPVVPSSTGQWYQKDCDGVFVGAVFIATVDPLDLLAEARRYLELPAPVPGLSPDGEQLVNLATWLRLDGGWSTETSTAAVPGVSVTVTATPETVRWNMGDGTIVSCAGAGSPTAAACTHTYRRSSATQPGAAYPASATVVWRARWAVTGASGGGDLGTIERTTAFDVRVAERQTVNHPPH